MNHTPTPWQRSYYVDKPHLVHMPEQWKVDRTTEERQIIRGPGVVGTPECNIVIRATNAFCEDLNFIVRAVNSYDALLASCKAALALIEREGGLFPVTVSMLQAAIAQAELDKERAVDADR